VFSRAELELVAKLCIAHGVIGVTDEIYEHIVYDGAEHVTLGSLPGMEELSVTINALSKTYSVTGWRVGWAIACAELTDAIRKVHDFCTVGAAAPLQEAGAFALGLPREYYVGMAARYRANRDLLCGALERVGFGLVRPQGAYYVITDITAFHFANDVEFARFLVEKVGVAGVPGSSFYRNPVDGSQRFRFNFCKKDETLTRAIERLERIPDSISSTRR
jgi:aminotransferase